MGKIDKKALKKSIKQKKMAVGRIVLKEDELNEILNDSSDKKDKS